MTKNELKNYIKRELGHPLIKVELSDDHLDDSISRTINMHDKWAMGNATQTIFFTKVISAGEVDYLLPDGVVGVIDMEDSSDSLGTANQLFTIQNSMLNSGMLPSLHSGFSLVSYHLALDYLDMLRRYTVSSYNWHYHKYKNTITLSPVPSAADNWSTTDTNFMLVRALIKEGYPLTGEDELDDYNQDRYEDPWIQEYCIALSKIKLGYIRRKFATGAVLGNSSIELDGSDLMQEGKEEKERLEEDLMNKETYEGMDILIG